ncbi:MAG TPA: DNA repair protein RecO [Thermoanaerobaculia bacterium]|nr:DNA repair protein RecO [Thermoanaerobaculia bacterium]
MSLSSAEALVLAVVDLHDRDKIVTFLTRERGKLRGVARGARRKYSRFAGQLQPLAKLAITWYEKEGRELVRISGAEVVALPTRLQGDLEGILVGSYLAEHLIELVQENEPAELYFRLLDATLGALAAGVDRDLVTRWFEVWALQLAGVFPVPEECPRCGRPYAAAGGAVLPASGESLVCRDCAGGAAEIGGAQAVPPEVLGLVARFARERPAELAAQPPRTADLRRIEELTGRVRRAFLERELRSYVVMQRTLAGF